MLQGLRAAIQWHRKQEQGFRKMEEDHRVGPEGQERAKWARIHHAGSAASLMLLHNDARDAPEKLAERLSRFQVGQDP